MNEVVSTTPDNRAESNPGPPPYCVPCSVILAGLGISLIDLARSEVSVSGSYLRFLLSRLAAEMPLDPAFYAEQYPDVRVAFEAEIVPSYHWHFTHQGWYEGRWPYQFPFDPGWYPRYYRDLARLDTTEPQTLRLHFENTGYQEGRAGIARDADQAETWRLGTVISSEAE
jgi:hypothetical protein